MKHNNVRNIFILNSLFQVNFKPMYQVSLNKPALFMQLFIVQKIDKILRIVTFIHIYQNLNKLCIQTMNFNSCKVGIWGYGVVGASALRYFKNQQCSQIGIIDTKPLSQDIIHHHKHLPLKLFQAIDLHQFLNEHDFILPSPGIDLRAYQAYSTKFLNEFDLFSVQWHKPIIAITGTIGKTTITHILSHLLQTAGHTIATGGNIGVAMLDLLAQQTISDYALLELSSFQLEYCAQSAPSIAVITNIYPNHLDRHGSLEQYQAAKYRISTNQTYSQITLAPLHLARSLRHAHNLVHTTQRNYHFFSDHQPTSDEYALLIHNDSLYYYHEGMIFHYCNGDTKYLCHMTHSSLTYPINWLILHALLDILNLNQHIISQALATLEIPEHRLSCIAHHNGISFYNDSKATIPEATLAALKKLQGKPLILFLGGTSKGVNRHAALLDFKNFTIKHIICFGKEAVPLKLACDMHVLPATAYDTLEAAFANCMHDIAQSGDHILFSPAGASFDLFTHYQARGDRFKELVNRYINND